uniref:Putative histone deacetylase complex sin3 component n=2 Tax=Ornithodoros turicata TaxID=34597 RepID=A0A2R5LG34_9ACAR
MAASSTIRRTPHSLTRKQSKQQRDTEATLALLASNLVESDPQKEEREVQFAVSYLQKVQEVLQDDNETFQRFMRIVDDHDFLSNDRSAAQVFEQVSEVFAKYPELVDGFVSFLLPEQAVECGKFTEYLIFSKIRLFLRKLEVHFSQQPQQLQRILKTLNQVQRQPDLTAETLCSMLQPLLRGQSHLLDEFLKLLPSQKVPESDMTDFEEVTIPDGEEEDSCEEVTLSPAHETLGTKECPCPCHQEGNDTRYVSRARHCTKCGIKFLDGRVFIQTGKVMRPAHVIFGSVGPSPPWRGSLPRSPTTKSPLRSPPETTVVTLAERPMSPISLSGDIGRLQDGACTDVSTKQDNTSHSCGAEPNRTENPVQQPPIKLWSREEDGILLQSCQRLGSERGVQEASGALGRPRDQVQCRFQELMALFEAHNSKDGNS